MLDHVGFAVADYARSKAFYEKALRPLGIALLTEVTPEQTGGEAHAGFGENRKPYFWIGTGAKPKGGQHVADIAGDALLQVASVRMAENGRHPAGDLLELGCAQAAGGHGRRADADAAWMVAVA